MDERRESLCHGSGHQASFSPLKKALRNRGYEIAQRRESDPNGGPRGRASDHKAAILLGLKYCTISNPMRTELSLKGTEDVPCDGIGKLSNRSGQDLRLETREKPGA